MIKKCFIVLIGVVALTLTFSGVVFAEADGFRGIKWGTEFSTLSNVMTYVGTDPSYGGFKIYSKKDDKLKMGKADIEMIEYSFWNDKLSDVTISVKGNRNFNYLKEATFEEFGKGDKFMPNRENYIWSGTVTNMILNNREASVPGALSTLSMSSIKIIDEAQRQHKEKGKAERGF